MSTTAKRFVDHARAWIGKNESDGSYKSIIDLYNSHKPLARGYKVSYSDSWCAVFVSAVALASGASDIVPLECGCEKMIDLCKIAGIYIENDEYIPAPGDIIFYDWGDSGKGDCNGWADHVGIVENCDGVTITAIEGNKSDSVSRRSIAVNGRYIRGFAHPNFEAEESAADYLRIISEKDAEIAELKIRLQKINELSK